MPTLSEDRIAELLQPYLGPGPDTGSQTGAKPERSTQVFEKEGIEKLGVFLDLLLRWNARTNLTAIADPEEIVRRHFGESLFAARHLAFLPTPDATLLDFGSGAGFPGIPIQLYRPDLRVMLAESQGKKAAFLREVVRTLGLETEVWAGRVEDLPIDRNFDAVAMRAVDRMESAILLARSRVALTGTLAVLGGPNPPGELSDWVGEAFALPESEARKLYLIHRNSIALQ